MFLFFDAQIVEESIFFFCFFGSKTVESMKKKEGKVQEHHGLVGVGCRDRDRVRVRVRVRVCQGLESGARAS